MFIIAHRRRREQKTNFKRRLALIKSGKPRMVVRKSLEGMSIQFVQFNRDGDKTLCGAVAQELKKSGWSFSLGNTPAAYLTGLLAGKKAKRNNITEAVLDIGMQTSTKGSRLYAALKGVVDAGVDVPHDKEMFPSDDRILGKHIKGAEGLTKNFEETKNKIMS